MKALKRCDHGEIINVASSIDDRSASYDLVPVPAAWRMIVMLAGRTRTYVHATRSVCVLVTALQRLAWLIRRAPWTSESPAADLGCWSSARTVGGAAPGTAWATG
jgi:hypothetical protein